MQNKISITTCLDFGISFKKITDLEIAENLWHSLPVCINTVNDSA